MEITGKDFKDFVALAKKYKLETASLTLNQDGIILASGYAVGSLITGIFVAGRGLTVSEAVEELVSELATLNDQRQLKIERLEAELSTLKEY